MAEGGVETREFVIVPENPDGLWNQRKMLLERRLKGKKGRTGQYKSPLGSLQEKPLKKLYSEEEKTEIYEKSLKIVTHKGGNKNLDWKEIVVTEQGFTPDECLNKAWDTLAKQWGKYWNPPAAGTLDLA